MFTSPLAIVRGCPSLAGGHPSLPLFPAYFVTPTRPIETTIDEKTSHG